jgi:hypothetical protein
VSCAHAGSFSRRVQVVGGASVGLESNLIFGDVLL